MLNMMSNVPSVADIAAIGDGNRNSNNDGWGGNNGWWVIILLFALFGWGRGGFGGYGDNAGNGNGCCCSAATVGDIQRGFDNQGVMNKLNGLEQGICSLGYDQLNQMNGINNVVQQTGWGLQQSIQNMGVAQMQDTNALSRQLADCCCENRTGQMQIMNQMGTDTCAVTTAINQAAQNIIQNDNANYRQLHDEMFAIQMQAKDEKIAEQASLIQSLNLAASQANQNTALMSKMDEMVNTLRPCPTPAYITCNPWASNAPYGSCCNNNGCGNGCCA